MVAHGRMISAPTARPRAFRKPCRGRRSRRPVSAGWRQAPAPTTLQGAFPRTCRGGYYPPEGPWLPLSGELARREARLRGSCLSLRQKSSIFATSSLLSVTLRVTSLLAEESLALVRGRQGRQSRHTITPADYTTPRYARVFYLIRGGIPSAPR